MEVRQTRPVERIEAALGERWGGIWGQRDGTSNVLHVGVVRPTLEDILFVDGERERMGQPVIVVSVARSWSELLTLQEHVHQTVLRRHRGWVGCWPDPGTNTVKVELSEAHPVLVEQLLTTLPAGALSLSISPRASSVLVGVDR